jgi:hypothetical protein
MSIFCSIDTCLKVKFNEDQVRAVLKKIHTFDCLFFDFDANEIITVDEGIKVLFRNYDEPDDNFALGMRYKNTFLDLFIKKIKRKDESFLGIDFLFAADLWKVEYNSGSYGLDMGRYVNSIIEILETFKIEQISYQVVR